MLSFDLLGVLLVSFNTYNNDQKSEFDVTIEAYLKKRKLNANVLPLDCITKSLIQVRVN